MKVKDLVEQIEWYKKEYDDFLSWDVFLEQLTEDDKSDKRGNPQWKWLTDDEGWEYVECAGFWTAFPDDKAFSINVNY
jgi:hypothetical protein